MPQSRHAYRQRAQRLIERAATQPPLGPAEMRRLALSAHALALEAGDRLLEAEALLLLGGCRTPLVEPAQALSALRQAEQIFRANELPHRAASCMAAAARALHDMSEERNALDMARAALDEPCLPVESRAFALLMTALSRMRLSQLDSALHCVVDQALPLARSCDSPYLLAQALCVQAQCRMAMWMVRSCPDLYQGLPGQPIEVGTAPLPADILALLDASRQALPEGVRWACVETTRLLVVGLSGSNEAAELAARQLSRLAAEQLEADPPWAAWSLVAKSHMLRKLGQAQPALSCLLQARAVAESVGQLSILRDICLHQARLYEAAGDLPRALTAHKRFTELWLRGAWQSPPAPAGVGAHPAVVLNTGGPDAAMRGLRVLEPVHVKRAIRYIADRLGEPLPVTEVVRHCGVSRRTLETAFKEARAVTIADYIKQRRLERAAHELLHTDRAVQEIAASVGYRTAAGFARDFGRRFGAKPSQWRLEREASIASAA